MKRFLLALALCLLPSLASAQCNGVFATGTVCGNASGVNSTGKPIPFASIVVPGSTNGQTLYNNNGAFGGYTPSGDLTLVPATGVVTLTTVNGNVGSFGSTTQCVSTTVNAKGLTTAISAATCAPAIGSVTGLAAGIATWLVTPSSANLRAAVTDETGTGALYFQGGDIGTPSAGVGTNLTSLNATQLTSGTLPAARTNGHMNGTATNDNAAAGEVGELLSNSAGTVALTTTTPTNAGQITLTAGDWDVYCSGYFSGAGGTSTTDIRLGINTVSATLPTLVALQTFIFRVTTGIVDLNFIPTVGPFRVSITGASVIHYCVAQATFVTSTYSIAATIRARRIR